MILFPFSHSAMEITCKTSCRSFPFVFQHLEPSLTSSPLPFTGCETEGQLLGCVGSSPLEGHRTQMQEGYRRSSENSQQLCEPPRSYITTMACKIQGGVAPWITPLFSYQSYTKNYLNYNSWQFGCIYTTATNENQRSFSTDFWGAVLLVLKWSPVTGSTPRVASKGWRSRHTDLHPI